MALSPHTPYRPDIDGLRALAVAAVVAHHAFPYAVPSGFVGVDIFFVISGYLISQTLLGDLHQGRWSLAGFYARRIRRILPALLLVVPCTLIAAHFVMLPLDQTRLGTHAMAAAVFASNVLLWSESGYFDAEAFRKPLLHLWSLAIEEQFYIVWPALLWITHRLKLKPTWVIALVVLASLLYSLWLLRVERTAAFYSPFSRFWELAAGALLAALPHASRVPGTPTVRSAKAAVAAIMGLLLLALVFARLTPERRFPGGWALAAVVATVLIIASGPHSTIHRRLLAHRALVGIGLISYPLYLWHWPLLSLARIRHGGLPPANEQWGWIALSTLLAWLTWRWVEQPVRFGRFSRGPGTVAILLAGLVLLAVAGWGLSRPRAADEDLPPLVRTLQTKGGEAALTEGWRVKDCMLGFEQTSRDFKPFCTEHTRPMVFLWGDSHAGSLYPGLKALQDAGTYRFGITERTSAICPPVLGHEPRPLCRQLNDDILEDVRRLKPDIVLLYAFWHEQLIHGRYDMANLETTIAAVRAAGAGRVVVIGDAPFWRAPLPALLLDEWAKGPRQAVPRLRLPNSFLDDHVIAYSREVKRRTERAGGEFIQGLDVFCDRNGCLTRLHERADEPTTYDYGHLTVAAATHFIAAIAPRIFGKP